MHASFSSTSVLFPLLFVLIAQSALIPASILFNNGTRLGLPVANLPGALPIAGAPPSHVSSRTVVLAFLRKGKPIPESEVKETLIDADEIIGDLVRQHPNQRIANDRFEYHRPDGNMLISIKANTGEVISWTELSRILKALYRYMTAGPGSEQTHYRELEFEIEAGGQEKPNIGLGLVWYFRPTGSNVQKRLTLPLPNLIVPQPFDETTRRLPDATLVMPGGQDVQEDTIFHIPRTSLSLSFHYLGPPIPARSIEATLQGAMAKIRPLLNGATENHRIENDGFRWILPRDREAGITIPVAVTVLTYHAHLITWRQLFNILFGLYAFATTFGTDLSEPHYQNLAFRVLNDNDSSPSGVGTISYYRSDTDQLAKRVDTIDGGTSLWKPRGSNVSLLDLAVSSPIVYPVADTDVTLCFTFLGDTRIPPQKIFGTLDRARERIAYMVLYKPDEEIPHKFHEMSTSSGVSINVNVYLKKAITWKELDNVLKGILQFCRDDENHERVLVFEIDVDAANRGRVGFGTVLYFPLKLTHTEKPALTARDTIPL